MTITHTHTHTHTHTLLIVVRKAKLADVSRMPMRRGRSKVTSSSALKRGRFDDEPSSSSASKLLTWIH